MGPYAVENFSSNCTAVFTNKPIVTPVRGAGRQQGIYIIERMMDIAATQLGIDPLEIRKKNFIPSDAFPYDNVIVDQAFTTLILDTGNYLPVFEKAAEMIGYEQFVKEEQPRLRAEGKHVGIAVTPFIETTGVGPYEGARVQIEANGKVNVTTGYGTQGQGHFTSFAQIVSEQLSVPVKDIRVVTGDTAEFHWGTGTFASRGIVVAGNAIHAAASAVRQKVLKLASKVLETPEDELELEDGFVRVGDMPSKNISLGELATLANPLRGAVEPGFEPGLEATDYFGPQTGTTASGTHAMILEVDPETMMVEIKRYVAVEDCGKVINPLIVEGQIHGGVSMGIGNAYYERLHFDENGQILNATLADYLIVTPYEMPSHIETGHWETLSPLNKLGTKGVGEAGAIPVPALFAQALENALQDYKLEILETPLSPNRLFELLNNSPKITR
jgi:CO/xanthine dehydrogenase Mo-binding subunit